ncbi:hypothetical protein [Mycolicibacterium thermoresistibile]
MIGMSVRVRNYFATSHLWIARHHARLCREQLGPDGPEGQLYRSHVLVSVFFAAAYLEGLVNEVLLDTIDPRRQPPETRISTTKVPALRQLWEKERSIGVIGKYRKALAIVNSSGAFSENRDPFKSAEKLLEMRNHYVHYKPEWREGTHEYERDLNADRAEWAVNAADRFAKSWWKRMGLKGHHDFRHSGLPAP